MEFAGALFRERSNDFSFNPCSFSLLVLSIAVEYYLVFVVHRRLGIAYATT